MAAPEFRAESSLAADMCVIDADTHLSEPEDLWTKRSPARFKDRVPQIGTIGGRTSWVIDGKYPIGNGAGSSIRKDGHISEEREHANWRIEDVIPSAYDVGARLKMMDEQGIHAQVIYPNVIGFGGQATAMVDPELRLVSTQIFNDAMIELQEEANNRLFPMAMLPWWDIDEAVRETVRAHANGLRGININSDPHKHMDADGNPIPDLSEPYWTPLWEVCESLDMPINFHIGASDQSMSLIENSAWPALPLEMRAAIIGSMLFIDNGRVLGNIIYSGLLDRHPKLRFVSVESGLGWIPFMLESLDYQFRSLITKSNLLYKPSEYFKKNFLACFWFEKSDLSHLVAKIGVDNCMFETDFPHPVCLHPAPLDYVEDGLALLDANARRKVMGLNAARVYKIAI